MSPSRQPRFDRRPRIARASAEIALDSIDGARSKIPVHAPRGCFPTVEAVFSEGFLDRYHDVAAGTFA